MKVCTAVVVVVAAAALLVSARPPKKDPMDFWIGLMLIITKGVCGPNMCWPEGQHCYAGMEKWNTTTQEQRDYYKDIIGRCTTKVGITTISTDEIDFDNVKTSDDPRQEAIYTMAMMRKYKVPPRKVYPYMECLLEETGETEKLLTCLEKTQTEDAEQTTSETSNNTDPATP